MAFLGRVVPVAMRIAVTGATGIVGGHVIEVLLARGHRLRVLCRRPDALAADQVEVVVGDLAGIDATAFLDGVDVLLHMAGAIKAVDKLAFFAVNAAGTGRLVEAAVAAARQPRVVLLSSLAAREPQLSDYAASKRAGEEHLRAHPALTDWKILRAPAVYGPGDRETLDIFRQCRRGFCPVPGKGTGRFSLIYVTDLAAALADLLEAPGLAADSFELHDGPSLGHDWLALARAAAKALGRPVRLLPVPRPLLFAAAGLAVALGRVTGKAAMLTPGKVREFCHDDWVARENLLESSIAWQPSVGLEEGFAEAIAWYKAEGWM